MATVKAFIRTGKKDKEVNIRFRLSDGRNVQLFHKSKLMVNPTLWDEKREQYKAKSVIKTEDRILLDSAIAERKKLLLSIYNNASDLTSEKLEQAIDKHLHPEKYQRPGDDFFSTMEIYLQKKKLSQMRVRDFFVLIRALKRYELFASAYEKKEFKLEISEVTNETIEDFESFLRNEHTLYNEYPEIYEAIPLTMNTRHKAPKPLARGNNTISSTLKRLRSFFRWCTEQGITNNQPFIKYKITSEKYGTPYYLTLEERNHIAEFDLSQHPQLAIQRDIFIFQCLIGCRISDLLNMTEQNIINDAIEYIPHKTKDDRPIIVRVPLNERAKILIEKYKGADGKGKLFPFISAQKYNEDIKEIFRLCGVIRSVTVINPTTGEEEKYPINEVASSHMARRTFIGNLYKKVKDPNLVGSLSGHKEGSKAFSRYREIDDDIKKELVNMIE